MRCQCKYLQNNVSCKKNYYPLLAFIWLSKNHWKNSTNYFRPTDVFVDIRGASQTKL